MSEIRLKIVLILVVPLVFLGFIELLCQGIMAFFLSEQSSIVLQMPTWMAEDQNARMNGSVLKASAQDLEWMSLFEKGENFRVHLKPGVEAEVINSFSKLPDKEKYHIQANSLGFRGTDLTPGALTNKKRILVFGDSSSFGWGIQQDATYSALLPQKLRNRGFTSEVEIGNFAIPGDSSAYGKMIFDQFAPRFPSDLIILGFGANDAKRAYVSHTTQVEKFRSQVELQMLSHLAHRSALYRLLERVMIPSKEPSHPPTHPAVSRKNYRTNLESMAKEARRIGARMLILTLCTPEDYIQKAKRASKEMDSLFFDGQGYLIDSIPSLKSHEKYPEMVSQLEDRYSDYLASNDRFYITSDLCHPNGIGHQLIADQISDIIINNRVFETQEKIS